MILRRWVTRVPPCDPQLISSARQRPFPHPTRSVRRAGGFVLTGKQETIRTRRWLLGDWSFHSDPADFQRMPVEDATPNEFCFKLALMGHTPRTVVDHRLERTVAVPQQDTDNRQLRRFQDSYRQNFTIWRNMRREFRILGYRDFSFCGLVGRKFLNLQPSEFHLSRKPTIG